MKFAFSSLLSLSLLLTHGILGFADTQGLFGGLIKYWGGMDEHLRSQGAAVHPWPISPWL